MDGKPVGRRKKKLSDAGRYWARGGESYKDAIEDLKLLNAPDSAIEELLEMQKSEDFEVWPENWPALQLFLRVQTQWRATYGAYYGLDYNTLFSAIELYQLDDRADIFERVQNIEFGIIDALREEK